MIHPTKPAPAIDVPFPEELLGSRVVIQGASGAGKTYAIRRILESRHARMQHFVLDVEDELFTLRERFDYVLIGGDGADAPITEDTAEELARALLELGVSAILQLNDLGLAGQRRVIARFLTGLMKAPPLLWHPVLVTLDEAHRYALQSGCF
jgi:DNA helicase HerA-like ATPase